MEEPFTNDAAPHLCSTPHSAPVASLKYDPGIPGTSPLVGEDKGGGPAASAAEENLLSAPSADADAAPPPMPGAHRPPDGAGARHPHEGEGLTPEQQRRRDIDGFLAAYERVAPEQERRDGWSPFLRKLFLQVIAETGEVTLACAYTKMSRSAAYALHARDRVFAAGWNAAAYMARNPMADDFYEKAKHGITETIVRSDGVTVTRHRFDSRLSIAVLNRLDKRCDRAEERSSVHLAAVRNWDEYLRLVGEGDDRAAEALLETPQHCPTCPLPERTNPIPAPDPPGFDLAECCWQIGDDRAPGAGRDLGLPDGTWMTTFPPPPGFDGYQNIEWDGDNWYERACTPEEVELLEAHAAALLAQEQAELAAFAQEQRDGFFARLRSELAAMDPASVNRSSVERRSGSLNAGAATPSSATASSATAWRCDASSFSTSPGEPLSSSRRDPVASSSGNSNVP